MVPLVEALVPIVPWYQSYHGTIGRPNGIIGKPNSVSNIMINTFNLFLFSYFCVHILVFLLFANTILLKTVLICESYKS